MLKKLFFLIAVLTATTTPLLFGHNDSCTSCCSHTSCDEIIYCKICGSTEDECTCENEADNTNAQDDEQEEQ